MNKTILLCINCYEKEGDCQCENSHYVEIDEKMLFSIQKLNKLGYKTKYCCQGHNFNNQSDYISSEAYIMFCDNNKVFDTLPMCWHYQNRKYAGRTIYHYDIIRSDSPDKRTYNKLTMEQKEDFINQNITNLNNWCDSLPLKK